MNKETEYLNGCEKIIETQNSIKKLKKQRLYHLKKLRTNILKSSFKFFIDFGIIPLIFQAKNILFSPVDFVSTFGLCILVESMYLAALGMLYLFDVYPFFDFNLDKIKNLIKQFNDNNKAIKRKSKSIKLVNRKLDNFVLEDDNKLKSTIRYEIIKIDGSNYSDLDNKKRSNKDQLNDLKYLKDLYLDMKNNIENEEVKQKKFGGRNERHF